METTTSRDETKHTPTMRATLDVTAGGLAEILAAVDLTLERAHAGNLADVTASLRLIREALAELTAITRASAEGR